MSTEIAAYTTQWSIGTPSLPGTSELHRGLIPHAAAEMATGAVFSSPAVQATGRKMRWAMSGRTLEKAMHENSDRIDTTALLHERDALRDAIFTYDIAEARFRLLRIREVAAMLGLPAVETAAAALARALRLDPEVSRPDGSSAGPLADAMNALQRAIGTSSSS